MSAYQFLFFAGHCQPWFHACFCSVISSFVCMFVCAFAVLHSCANKAPFCLCWWYGPIKACDQPERFNDGCGAEVDRFTRRDRAGETDGVLWGGVCSKAVLWLSDSTADSRQGKISPPLAFVRGKSKGQPTVGIAWKLKLETDDKVLASKLFYICLLLLALV